jgi:hypothetical protein
MATVRWIVLRAAIILLFEAIGLKIETAGNVTTNGTNVAIGDFESQVL